MTLGKLLHKMGQSRSHFRSQSPAKLILWFYQTKDQIFMIIVSSKIYLLSYVSW
jgi:hypothetical protein